MSVSKEQVRWVCPPASPSEAVVFQARPCAPELVSARSSVSAFADAQRGACHRDMEAGHGPAKG